MVKPPTVEMEGMERSRYWPGRCFTWGCDWAVSCLSYCLKNRQ